jgi:hypothetical protein
MVGTTRPTPLLEEAMKHLTRILATLAVGLSALLGLAGTALAYTDPIRPESGTIPVTSPHLSQVSAYAATSSGWSPALVVGVVILVLLGVALTLVGQRLSRHHRQDHAPAFGV